VINAVYRKGDWATTADGAAHVAVAAADVRARLVHVSSDAVFSGAADRYDEACLPDPRCPVHGNFWYTRPTRKSSPA
jgi:dTDP-4-dehydrorhamnose reductase